ncbi:hypothetical protein G3576_29265 [Roseomonas stagni]|uniref:Uncharacterized protein n=1 Tax=Falsiroseomonas algicola TaxID=2716930 RepID=A0A6M1LVX6_9PROT|nr:hypothetical protein [Falsiroseomonas algicola]NGM24132.1 hypothetical protein [Falsiroseomonas algicola]
MIEALFAWFVATFLLGPLQSGMTAALEAGRAPAAVVEQVTRCAADATPGLVDRALGDPWWAISTAIGASIGTVAPESVLRDAAPGCEAAIAAARPFMNRG